jgi:hypothetical protein
MSRGLQWLIGVCAVLVTLAIVFAVLAPWIGSWNIWGGYGRGMMGGLGGMMGGGMMGGNRFGYGSGGGYGPGMMGSAGGMMGGGMMPWGQASGGRLGSGRLSIDQARTLAEEYAAAVSSDLAVVEVMEFQNNFYAVLEETSTGRAALEVLIDPFTGAAGPEPGPNMMWNEKYGHMSFGTPGANGLSMEEARQQAQASLESQLPGSIVHDEGAEFYGYFTFDYDGSDGTITGMLSVDASNGSVWLHTWHGEFVQEWEAES